MQIYFNSTHNALKYAGPVNDASKFKVMFRDNTAVNDQIVHFYDRSLKIFRITDIAEIIISRYGSKSNSILVDVLEYDMRSTRTSIVKKWEIE